MRADLPFDLDELTEALLGYYRFAAQWRSERGYVPRPGSPLEAELSPEDGLACEWDDGPIRRAVLIGELQLLSAEQHLVGLAMLLRNTDLAWPVLTTLRALLETAARAWRLLDPAIDGRTRVARAMTEELYSKSESDKLPAALRPSIDVGVYQRSAAALGLQWIPGKVCAVHERRPSSTVLTAAFVTAVGGREGDVHYRFTSAVTHGTVYGLTVLTRTLPDGIQPELAPKLVAASLMLAAVCFGEAFQSLLTLADGDLGSWYDWHGRALDVFTGATAEL